MKVSDLTAMAQNLVGDSATNSLFSSSQWLEWFNAGLKEVAKKTHLFMYADPSSVTLTEGSFMYAYPSLSDFLGIREVYHGNKSLEFIDRNILDKQYPNWRGESSGSPIYWYRSGITLSGSTTSETFGVYPKPDATAATTPLTVYGYRYPSVLTGNAETDIIEIPETFQKILAYYAAQMAAVNDSANEEMAARAVSLQRLYSNELLDLAIEFCDSATIKRVRGEQFALASNSNQ